LYVHTKVKVVDGQDSQLLVAADQLKSRISHWAPAIEDIELYKDIENEGYYWLKQEWESQQSYDAFQADVPHRDEAFQAFIACLEDPAVEVSKTRRVIS
jgi:hypothetical protein